MFSRHQWLANILLPLPFAVARLVTSTFISDVVSTSLSNVEYTATSTSVVNKGRGSSIFSIATTASSIYTQTLLTWLKETDDMGFVINVPTGYSTRTGTDYSRVHHWTTYDKLSTQLTETKQTKQVPVVTTMHVPMQTVIDVPDAQPSPPPATPMLASATLPTPLPTASQPSATDITFMRDGSPLADPFQSTAFASADSQTTDLPTVSPGDPGATVDAVLTVFSTKTIPAVTAPARSGGSSRSRDLGWALWSVSFFHLVTWLGGCAMHSA